ncbi:MAP/microtubule affinity-regulating kinase 4-like isoform X1 [Microcebus murinus]|uniref:MAP/microtubule affinity-regulating kinase 4-like n=2 Tax=Microcebus murinus TaxID=30608 RepID=UPI003F6C9EEB
MAQALAPSLRGDMIGNYKLIRQIGSGRHSQVFKGVHTPTLTKVAVKIISRKSHPRPESLHTEADAMRGLAHENVTMLLYIIEDEDRFCLVTGYSNGGNLSEYIRSRQRLSEEEARPMFRQLLSAVRYCHAQHIAHRDLQPDNILLDKLGNVKLADFGDATTFNEGDYLDTYCGSPAFMAPELLLQEKYVGPEADVWSLGIVLYNMVAGRVPFAGDNWEELKTNVTQGTYETPDYFSAELTALLGKFLTTDSRLRPTIPELLEDPWFQGQETPKPKRKPTVPVSPVRTWWLSPGIPMLPKPSPLTTVSTTATGSSSSDVRDFGGDSSLESVPPHGKSSASPAEGGQGLTGLARRLGSFLLRVCCIRPARNLCHRGRRLNKVVPVTRDP